MDNPRTLLLDWLWSIAQRDKKTEINSKSIEFRLLKWDDWFKRSKTDSLTSFMVYFSEKSRISFDPKANSHCFFTAKCSGFIENFDSIFAEDVFNKHFTFLMKKKSNQKVIVKLSNCQHGNNCVTSTFHLSEDEFSLTLSVLWFDDLTKPTMTMIQLAKTGSWRHYGLYRVQSPNCRKLYRLSNKH